MHAFAVTTLINVSYKLLFLHHTYAMAVASSSLSVMTQLFQNAYAWPDDQLNPLAVLSSGLAASIHLSAGWSGCTFKFAF